MVHFGWTRHRWAVALWIGLPAALVVAAAWPALFKCGTVIAPRGAVLLSIIPGVLLPLVFPRAAAHVRGAAGGALRRKVAAIRSESDAAPGRVDAADTNALRNRNVCLTAELADLRAAHAELGREVAERTEEARRLHFLAYHDTLTKLPNRALLMDRMTHALANAQRAGTGVLVAFLDLDSFKRVNDTLGHPAGDRVLIEIAARLAGCMRECDTASRIGGDEFVLVFATTDGQRDAARIESRLQQAIGAPIDIDGTAVAIGASLGMSVYPRDGSDPMQLIESADKAMYSAKFTRRD